MKQKDDETKGHTSHLFFFTTRLFYILQNKYLLSMLYSFFDEVPLKLKQQELAILKGIISF